MKPEDTWNMLFPPKVGDMVRIDWKVGKAGYTITGELMREESSHCSYVIFGKFEEHWGKDEWKVQNNIVVEVPDRSDSNVKVKIIKRLSK